MVLVRYVGKARGACLLNKITSDIQIRIAAATDPERAGEVWFPVITKYVEFVDITSLLNSFNKYKE